MNWFPFNYILDNLITNSIHAWLTKDYRSSGMLVQNCKSFNGNDTSYIWLLHSLVWTVIRVQRETQ